MNPSINETCQEHYCIQQHKNSVEKNIKKLNNKHTRKQKINKIQMN